MSIVDGKHILVFEKNTELTQGIVSNQLKTHKQTANTFVFLQHIGKHGRLRWNIERKLETKFGTRVKKTTEQKHRKKRNLSKNLNLKYFFHI